jgi:DNA-directed RNA polymerase subunit E'/Rpb7
MEHTCVFEEQVALTPKDMRVKIESVENILRDKLQQRLEGRCSRHGFVIPGSLKVLSRDVGSLEKGRFTGSIIFHIQAEGKVLNPPDGAIIEGIVIRKNKMGIYVSYMEDAIRVIIPRDLHIGNDAFEAVEIGEKVEVEVKKSRFQVNDPYILSVGTFRSSKGKKAVKAPALPPPPQPEEAVEETEEETEEEAVEEAAEEAEEAEEAAEEEAAAEDEPAAD